MYRKRQNWRVLNMATTLRGIIAMVRGRHFRETNRLPVDTAKLKRPNFKLAREIMDNYSFPDDDKKDDKPPS